MRSNKLIFLCTVNFVWPLHFLFIERLFWNSSVYCANTSLKLSYECSVMDYICQCRADSLLQIETSVFEPMPIQANYQEVTLASIRGLTIKVHAWRSGECHFKIAFMSQIENYTGLHEMFGHHILAQTESHMLSIQQTWAYLG